MFKQFKEYFSFTKKELNGLLVLCILMVIVWVSPSVVSLSGTEKVYDPSEFKKEIAAFRASEKKYVKRNYYREPDKARGYKEDKGSPVYFKFNPNNLAVSDWVRLGISEKQARVIKNYEAKGGTFRRKEDLKKMYSIRPEDYSRLAPYIDIPEEQKNEKVYVKKEYPSRRPVIVEVNSADSAMLETVRGIGPVLASRIIRYRERLGGFYRKEQLKEVYGIDSLRYPAIAEQLNTDAGSIRKININTAGFDELRNHPYLTYKQKNAIIQYRKQHGAFTGIGDLRKIAILNTEILRKIAPYLIF